VGYLAPFSVGMFVNMWRGMLFVKLMEGKQLLVVLHGLGLCVACSCMVGSTVKDTCGSWIGIMGEG
jgi:hypothetical protein